MSTLKASGDSPWPLHLPILLPEKETERLTALHCYGILNTPPEQDFDELTRLAAQICGTPIALVSLIDTEREWFKSRLDLELSATNRARAFAVVRIAIPWNTYFPSSCLSCERSPRT